MRVYLIGFMGSGKSYVGAELAARLIFNFLDLDAYIEEQEGKSISTIFEEKGEPYFRNLERKYLRQTKDFDDIIIATGGGTACFFDNIDFINTNGLSVYLDVSEDILASRLQDDKAHRPLINTLNEDDLLTFIINKIAERKAYYEQSHIIYHFQNNEQDIINELFTYFKKIHLNE